MSTAHPPLPAAVSGQRLDVDGPAGRISVYLAGEGPPLLLVHSVNAAASAAEVRPLHEHYRATRTVCSVDLPGYGFAERGPRGYTPRLMTDAVHAAAQVLRQRCGHVPIDALALSLGSEFLARAAVEAPGVFRSLALVSPTGFNGRRVLRDQPGSTRHMPWLGAALRGPGGAWGGPLFRTLTTPGVIRYFLRRAFGSDTIDDELWRYAVVTTRQPGAEHAPLAFLSGVLFSADIHRVYEQLKLPVWMTHGTRGDFVDYSNKVLVAQRPNWRITVIPGGAMPYFEDRADFCRSYDTFLAAA
jgi:pimeloyl-ACP methyl ester carboxylesterase